MTVTYEWDCETVADGESEDYEDEEVIDHMHGESLKDVRRLAGMNPAGPGMKHKLVLVRDDDDRRAWAYLDDGKLPEWFEDADGRRYSRVPKRFHAEVARACPPAPSARGPLEI